MEHPVLRPGGFREDSMTVSSLKNWVSAATKKKAVPKLHSSGAQDRWRSLVPGDLNHATGLTMPRVIHQKLLTRWPWFVFWKTFLIRLNNVQKTHRQSGDFTNRNGMDTRKNSGEFPGKKQLQAMCFFLWGHSWRDFPGQIYITENPMGKFHHVKMGWEPMVNWSPSSHPIWIRGHWVYLNPELNMVWWCPKVVLVVHLVVRHIWRHITRFSIVFVWTNISVNYIEDSSLRYSWLVRLGKIV